MSYSKGSLKVVIIGAGSSTFGPPNLYDLISQLGHTGFTLSLVDINEENLELMHNAAGVITESLDKTVQVQSTTKRGRVLQGADFVLVTAEQNRIEKWKIDWEIPKKYGINHTLGENRGPAGLSHTLRTVPLVMDICRDIENIAPEAFTLILTNPEDRITRAVNKYTDLDVAGYCDGPWDFRDRYAGDLLGIPGEQIYLEGAGINHAVWITEIVDKENGDDLYPKLVEKAKQEDWQPLGQHLYETYGYWPYENDEHYGEYFGYACDYVDCKGYDFDAYIRKRKEWKQKLTHLKEGDYDNEEFVEDSKQSAWYKFGDTPPSKVVKGLFVNEGQFMPTSIDIPNQGTMSELPDDMIVEVPTVITRGGIQGVKCNKLPEALNSFLHREGVIQKLSAKAPIENSRKLALKALLMDSSIDSPDTANKLLNDFLESHKESIPTLKA